MWLKDLFKVEKPVIGMVHLQAMPTDPKYDIEGGIAKIVDMARKDLVALQDGGVDGILFCNEFSIPYTRKVNGTIIATFSEVIGELKQDLKLPFGITCASSPKATFDIAAATGADFVRTHYHGANAGVYGINDYDPGDIERYRFYTGCSKVKVLTAVIQEGTKQIAERPLKEVVKTLTFNINPDGLLIYSSTPGSSIDVEQVKTVKEITDTPVLASNGVKPETVREILKYADGCIVGTGIKFDGNFYKSVDVNKVKLLMKNARSL